MTKLSHPGSLPYFPDGHFRPDQTPTALQSGPAGKLTQWAFHEVKEHPNRSSDEEVMTFRSWRSCRILAGRNPVGEAHPGEPSRADPAGVHQPGRPSRAALPLACPE